MNIIQKLKRLVPSLSPEQTDISSDIHKKLFECELFEKVQSLTSLYNSDEKLIVKVGNYYWDTLPQIWQYEWVTQKDRVGLVPVKVNKIERKNYIIFHDPSSKYAFEVLFDEDKKKLDIG